MEQLPLEPGGTYRPDAEQGIQAVEELKSSSMVPAGQRKVVDEQLVEELEGTKIPVPVHGTHGVEESPSSSDVPIGQTREEQAPELPLETNRPGDVQLRHAVPELKS